MLPIMPRTDFVAQYARFIEPKLKDQLSNKKTRLYGIIEKVSGAGPKLAKETFEWKPGTRESTTTGQARRRISRLELWKWRKFVNYVQGY